MAQSYLRNPSIERLPAILEELHTGSLCIPPFQRDFEWTGEQRLALCSSVRLGLPMGSLMVWRTNRVLETVHEVGPYLVQQAANPGRQYLLDGRQRLTTLYAALGAAFWTQKGKRPPQDDADPATERELLAGAAPDGTRWRIHFNLHSGMFEIAWVPWTDLPPGRVIPLDVLFDDTAFDEWRSRAAPTREIANRARALRTAFIDYQMPVVPLVTDDVGVVTLTFKRINNGGTPMSDADMVRALAWTDTFDVRDHLDGVRQELGALGWGEVADDVILQVVASIASPNSWDVDLERLARDLGRRPDLVRLAGSHIGIAAKFLSARVGIAGPRALPHPLILLFVARELGGTAERLESRRADALAAWAAETCIVESTIDPSWWAFRSMWQALTNRLDRAEDPTAGAETSPPLARECWQFGMRWERSKGTTLVLVDQCPRNGRDLSILNPHRLAAREGWAPAQIMTPEAAGMSFGAIRKMTQTALRSPANRIICDFDDVVDLRSAFFHADCPASILRSHLITPEAHAALIAGDLETFFETRRHSIIEAERRWVEARGGQIDLRPEPRTYAQG